MLKKYVGQIWRINFQEKNVNNMGKKISGKDWLNSWVNNLKENWVKELVGKLVEKMQWKNFVDKLG